LRYHLPRVAAAGWVVQHGLDRSYVIFLWWSLSAQVVALWIEDLSGYRHRKTAISTEFAQLRNTATESYSNFGLAFRLAG